MTFVILITISLLLNILLGTFLIVLVKRKKEIEKKFEFLSSIKRQKYKTHRQTIKELYASYSIDSWTPAAAQEQDIVALELQKKIMEKLAPIIIKHMQKIYSVTDCANVYMTYIKIIEED